MSLIPDFQIGLWNTWIFMLCHLLLYIPLMLFAKEQTKEMESPQGGIARWLYPVITILWVIAIIYSVFVPLRLGTLWFYVGLPVYILGLAGQSAVCVSVCATRVAEEPLTSGIYRFSRHPYYVTQLVMFIGIGLASASWLLLLFAVVYSYLHFIMESFEETQCLEKYGDAYRKYMVRTPRWIGIPKIGS
ncbi:methyltransferase family protein [Chloroflexota bacterium]